MTCAILYELLIISWYITYWKGNISKNNNMMLNHKQERIELKPVDDGLSSCTFKALFKWSQEIRLQVLDCKEFFPLAITPVYVQG